MDLPYPAPGSRELRDGPFQTNHTEQLKGMSPSVASAKFKQRPWSGIECASRPCPPGPLPPRRHTWADTVCERTPGSRPQPFQAPSDYRARLSAATRTQKQRLLWNQTPHKVTETARACQAQKPFGWGIFLSTCVQRRNNSSLDAYLRWQEHISGHLLGKTIQGHGHLRREFFRAFLWTNSQAQTKQSVWKHSCDKTDPHPRSLTWPQVIREARADQHPD